MFCLGVRCSIKGAVVIPTLTFIVCGVRRQFLVTGATRCLIPPDQPLFPLGIGFC